MILDSMQGKTEKSRKMGEKILENYKKQLAERMAQQKIDFERQNVSKMSSKLSEKDMDKEDLKMKRFQSLNSSEVPDPEIFNQILGGSHN